MRDFAKLRWKAQASSNTNVTSGMKTPLRPIAGASGRGFLSCPASNRKRPRDCKALFQEDQADPISVVVRVRPPRTSNPDHPKEAPASCVDTSDEDKLLITAPAKGFEKSLLSSSGELMTKQYRFTRVFPEETTQAEYYAGSAAPMVEDMMSTFSNYVMLAYGITGSGKTYTLEGAPASPGVLPRALEHLFEVLQQHEDRDQLSVCISYYEIYNDHIYDLLLPPKAAVSAASKPGELKVMEDSAGNVCVPGMTVRVVRSAKEAMEMQVKGSALRTKAGTRLNASSSRSHAIFSVMLCEKQDQENLHTSRGSVNSVKSAKSDGGDGGEGLLAVSRLSFVDMAGAERANRTGNSGQRFKESVKINGSLLALGRCLEALRHNQMNPSAQTQLIPYRTSKITHIFRDVLHGQGRIMLAVSVSPDECDYAETMHMLEYARAATDIKTMQIPVAPPAVIHATPSVAPTPSKRRKMLTESSKSVGAHRMTRSANSARAEDETDVLKIDLLNIKNELEVAKRSATTAKLEIRRELTKKMQLKLDETESMWKAKNETLLSELERLAASNREMLKMHAEGSLGEAATAMQEEMRQELREEVKLELEMQHQRELHMLKESMECEASVMTASLAKEKSQLEAQISKQGSSSEDRERAMSEAAELREQVGTITKQKEAVEQAMADLQAQVAASESQRQQELDLMMEELQALTREKDHADAAQEAEMAELQAKHDNDMEEATSVLRSELELLQSKYDGDLSAATADLSTQLEELQRKFATDLEAASKALQDAEEKASRAEGEVRAQMEERHQQEVAALKADHEAELARRDEDVRQLKRTMQEEFDMEDTKPGAGNSEVEALEEELQDKNRQQRELVTKLQAMEREQETLAQTHEEALRVLETQFTQEMDALREQHREETRQMETSLSESAARATMLKTQLQTFESDSATDNTQLLCETHTLKQQRKELMVQLEAMTKEKAMMIEQHQWEVKLLKDNASLDMQSVEHMTTEMSEMVAQKQVLLDKLISTRKEKMQLESDHVAQVDELKLRMDQDELLCSEMRKRLEQELDEEYRLKMEFLQTVMSEDSSFLVHELQATHKQKTEMKKQLDDTKRERDHLTQCLSILQSDHPSLFEEEGDLHQSLNTEAWKNIRNSMNWS